MAEQDKVFGGLFGSGPRKAAIMGEAIMAMQQAKAELLGVGAGKTATYAGASVTVIAGFSISEWGIFIGAVIGLLGLVFGQYWQIRRNRREEQIKKATIAALERSSSFNIVTDDYGNTTNATIQ